MSVYFRASTAVTLIMLSGPAFAQCLPGVPDDGDVVTCSGIDTDGVSQEFLGTGNLDDVTVTVNAGTIVSNLSSGEHTIELDDDAVIEVNAGGSVLGLLGEDAIHLDNDGQVFNSHFISADDDAIQAGNGLLVDNRGWIQATDEGINADDDAEVINRAGASIFAGDDAVKAGRRATIFNEGFLQNTGTDVGDPQDAIDLDSGTIINQDGLIFSNLGDGIDFDAIELDGDDDTAEISFVQNRGSGIIQGQIGIETDAANTSSQFVTLHDTSSLLGHSGVAANLGDGEDLLQLNDRASIFGDVFLGDMNDIFEVRSSEVVLGGDVYFGEGDNTLALLGDGVNIFSGDWFQTNGATFVGGTGVDTLSLFNPDPFTSDDFTKLFDINFVSEDLFSLDAGFGARVFFEDFDNILLNDGTFAFSDFAAIAPVPLPAGGLLLLGGLGGLTVLRRRRRA
ncbi:VPLPA-CTERM sorting domain-containing protein [Epibacterium ulvae]|uniref:VPLPA-CTERM sorting domain-containing protein n=1 Tax=Epibacterium ulvae TaxID=1156985 RepID=UPI001BFC9A00|nr:VPLPA-CTERM sorting domain-containing protein [Epibacterium ulvae]MBT8152519.1 VPLPA-CTERM sorting domain-containing protein [Epibacterium ulvae]